MQGDRPAGVMRWLTHDWHTGRLSEEDYEGSLDDYHRHRAALLPGLPTDLQQLARLNLHDGQVQEWQYDNGHFAWRLLIGDLQQGYEFVRIVYRDADLVRVSPAELTAFYLTHDRCELVSDEIDRAEDGRFEHRFYFWPEPEFGIRFSSTEVLMQPASAADRR